MCFSCFLIAVSSRSALGDYYSMGQCQETVLNGADEWGRARGESERKIRSEAKRVKWRETGPF